MHLKTFLLPHRYKMQNQGHEAVVAIIIPSFKPSKITLKLVQDIHTWHPNFQIYLVDDCTPLGSDPSSLSVFEEARKIEKVTVLRTPTNRLKAGAINYALSHIKEQPVLPEVIFTSDDDIAITEKTLPAMVRAIQQVDKFGAVCSQSRVINKNQNLLTRLQGLEYHGFNTARMSDAGFFQGPLVMHGMLTAFRGKALLETNGFDESCLIEDYEITVRLKASGWHVAMINDAPAWTDVPSNFKALWRQRVRWIYGGITVVSKSRSVTPIIQDLIGHSIFLATAALILASFFLPSGKTANGHQTLIHNLSQVIVILSSAQLLLWYIFQIWVMKRYEERDWKDWLIRLTLVPEFIYANVMSLILMGSYLFFLFNASLKNTSTETMNKNAVISTLKTLFRKLGFTVSWGTKNIQN